MKTLMTISVFAAILLWGTDVLAREWYEKGCTPTQKDKDGNYYVGGPYNKNHMHVGSTFVDITSNNNNSKPVTSGKENCNLINQAITDVPGGGFTSPNDVSTCLTAAKAFFGC